MASFGSATELKSFTWATWRSKALKQFLLTYYGQRRSYVFIQRNLAMWMLNVKDLLDLAYNQLDLFNNLLSFFNDLPNFDNNMMNFFKDKNVDLMPNHLHKFNDELLQRRRHPLKD